MKKAYLCRGLDLASLIPMPLLGQAVGAISGTVVDSTGSAITKANVSATRAYTGISQQTVTNSAGMFIFSKLVVGEYNVTAHADGFAPNTVPGVTRDVSQQRNLSFALNIAGSTQTTTVTVAEPLTNTTDGQLAGLVTEQQLVDMPLNGRSIENLVLLQPKMAADQRRMGWLAPQWASNGNRGETGVAQLDGADATDAEMGTVQFWNFNLSGADSLPLAARSFIIHAIDEYVYKTA
jgi:hypothetical protein